MRAGGKWSPARRAAYERILCGDGFLYAAEIVGTDKIKIGFSLNPRKRLNGLCPWIVGENGRRGRLLRTIAGSIAQERALHKSLRDHPSSLGSEFYLRTVLSHPAIPEGLRELS